MSSSSFRALVVACLAFSLIALSAALPAQPGGKTDKDAAGPKSNRRVSTLSRPHRRGFSSWLPTASGSGLPKSYAMQTADISGDSPPGPGSAWWFQQVRGQDAGEGRDGGEIEGEPYDDGVYNLAHFWYNMEDFTYALVDETNSTLLAKLAEVDDKVSDMETKLAEKDEELASLREEVNKLSSGSAEKEPSLGDVRLIHKVERAGQTKGRLLIYAGRQLGWGYVCDDMFYTASATVACKQIGYTQGVVSLRRSSIVPLFLGRREQYSIVMDDVQCRADDPDLLSCRHEPLGVHNCTPLEAVDIVCLH